MMEEVNIEPGLEVLKNIVQIWLKNVNGTTNFRDHWRIWVPKAFYHEYDTRCMEWTVKENFLATILIDNLEEYICGGTRLGFFKYLSEYDSTPSVCGKVFKMGEPTYNCDECGMDSTCVLCVSCFKQSAHKNHKYKMNTAGGGCCDCGDVEAWRADPYCETHLAGLNILDRDSLHFPPDFIMRTKALFTAALKYCYEILALENSLPCNLKLKEGEEMLADSELYCTVVYNDETHTFKQVINTLARVIKCSEREGADFTSNIDREGRAVVKCSTFQQCTELKSDIETAMVGRRPLQVTVVNSHVIVHQLFAMRLLAWLQKLTTMAKGFRSIFTDVALNVQLIDNLYSESLSAQLGSVVENILLRDSFLWKSARLHWHRLLLSGMFIEYESKKAFAKVFTSHYHAVLKGFIQDDHAYSFSIASFSVQIFTVPTIAHYLIAYEDILFIILKTFISECSCKCDNAGKLQFDKATPSVPFKRAMYILFDIKYLLGSPPDIWSDELRKGFLRGVALVLDLLTCMQGMDSVTRQVAQHIEYEPEWELAFNLHIKLAPVITLLLKWCSTDQKVLVEAYRLTHEKLYENPYFDPNEAGEVKELADHRVFCHQYDVSTKPVSIHLPLSRFLAGLYLHLEKCGLSCYSTVFASFRKPNPVHIIEPVLRTQVMIAQVHAGMWKKNGYSLSKQIDLYHGVKFRGEMLDKDIVLLQIGASLIECNEFLIHLLNKFGLLNWAKSDFEVSDEEGTKQTVRMVEEFLSLIITIVGERYVPGVADVCVEDCIKNEIMHQLFIQPLSHWELIKSLPNDIKNATKMENVINDVAIFKKPSQGSGKGVYEVKKELIDKYNVFFYHYTKEELSKSEEEQRKQHKAMNGFECCPPPALPKLSLPFSIIPNLLQCDVMLHIITIILERTINFLASFSENQVHKVLYLIGYALHEEENQNYSFVNFCARVKKYNLEYFLTKLADCPRVKSLKDLIHWTIRRYRAVSRQNKEDDRSLSPQYVKLDEDQQERNYRAALAAERRAKIMAKIAVQQQNFIKDNAVLFQNDSFSINDEKGSDYCIDETELMLNNSVSSVALGPKQSPHYMPKWNFTCIICQEDQKITPKGPVMVLAAFVHKSAVVVRNRNYRTTCDKVLSSNIGPSAHVSTCGHAMHSSCWKSYRETTLRQPSFDIERNEYLCPLCECLSNTVLPIMPHLASFSRKINNTLDNISFCSWYETSYIGIDKYHRASFPSSNKKCFKPEYNDSLKFDREPNILPQMASVASHILNCGGSSERMETDVESNDAIGFTVEQVEKLVPVSNTEECNMCDKLLCSSSAGHQEKQGSSLADSTLSDDLVEIINSFTEVATKHGLDRMITSPQDKPLTTLRACAYTIHSIEWLLRYTCKPLLDGFTSRQKYGLENLIRLSCALGVVEKEEHAINRIGVDLLTMLFSYNKQSQSVLDWDPFGLLVALTVSLPSMHYADTTPVPLGTVLEVYSLRMVLLSQFAQTIICTDMSEHVLIEGEDIVSEDTACLAKLVRLFKDCKGINTVAVWELLQNLSLSFLRCCVIFYHFLTGVPAPATLKEVGGDTFENILTYLSLPTSCKELLGDQHVHSIFCKWASHPALRDYRMQQSIRDMMPMNALVKLPEDYSELINNASLFTCPNSQDSSNPTMCLICGEMLCSQAYCCQMELNKILVSACTYHTSVCGAGAGIFLRVLECIILLISNTNRVCSLAAPYIDDYGEADQGLRRGNPLTLCKQRYRRLQLLWLSHSIQEEIAHGMESTQ